MLSNSREDELLNKLKSCIGTLQNSNAHFQMSKVTPNNYNTIKENYQQPTPNIPKSMNSNINTKNSAYNSYQTTQRQPLAPSNHLIPTPHFPTPQKSFQSSQPKNQVTHNFSQPYPQPRQNVKKWEESKTYQVTPRKYQYQPKKIDRQQRPKALDLEDRVSNKQQEVRGQISRRYSLMQHQKQSNGKYSQQNNPIKIVPPRNYQQQVEQRKSLLQSALEKRERTPTNIKKDYTMQVGSIRKQVNFTQRDAPKPSPSQAIFSSRKPEKPMMIKENLQRAYEEQKKVNPNECSALAKLRKISELNEKINDRIRNIINVFQQHKC